MKIVTIKKGYRFQMAGAPSNELVSLDEPSKVALCANNIPFVKPRIKVALGDCVKIGSLLMEDKRQAAIKFLSPAAGTVADVRLGPRRVIEAIVIDRDQSSEAQVRFPAIDAQALPNTARQTLVDLILQGGLWWIFRELPFGNLPRPDTEPPLIIVTLDNKEPFQPDPLVYLKNRLDLFRYGIQVLGKLADGQVAVSTDHRNSDLIDQCTDIFTHTVSGDYPSDNPATLLYHIKQSAAQNRAWAIDGQDVLLLAQLVAQGHYPTERVFAVGGSGITNGRHFRTRIGVPVAHLVDPAEISSADRMVIGGLMRGYTGNMQSFMGLPTTALTLIPQGQEARFLSLFNPGMSMPSYSRAFVSHVNPKNLIYDCNLNGGRRACIACMHCADICPVDILPQMAYKAILAEEIEESLQHGLLDCVECGLCSYVCPSKIELSHTFITAKAAYAKEIGKDSAA